MQFWAKILKGKKKKNGFSNEYQLFTEMTENSLKSNKSQEESETCHTSSTKNYMYAYQKGKHLSICKGNKEVEHKHRIQLLLSVI